jgi:hypothetical protein
MHHISASATAAASQLQSCSLSRLRCKNVPSPYPLSFSHMLANTQAWMCTQYHHIFCSFPQLAVSSEQDAGNRGTGGTRAPRFWGSHQKSQHLFKWHKLCKNTANDNIAKPTLAISLCLYVNHLGSHPNIPNRAGGQEGRVHTSTGKSVAAAEIATNSYKKQRLHACMHPGS